LAAETATARAEGGRALEEDVEEEAFDDEKRLNEFEFEEFEFEKLEELELLAASASASTRLGTPLAAPSVVP